MKQILMANDLSARSDRALRRAVTLAKEIGAQLEVITVIEEMFLDGATSENVSLAKQSIASQLAGIPDAVGAQITQRVVVGLGYEDIIRRSKTINADLIVLGIHRHKTKELFRGTTAERVIRYGARPVLVVRDPVAGPYRRVVVPTDLSSHAEAATRTAARLAQQGEITLVHAVHRPFVAFLGRDDQETMMKDHRKHATAGLHQMINRLTTDLGDRAPKFHLNLPEGDVPGALYEEIASLKPDLVAVGTHGRSGIAHAVIGSVAEQLLAECPVDVLAAKSAR